jgi:hypothetical protein
MPSSGWSAIGTLGFKYKDPTLANGPVKVAQIKKTPSGTFLVKALLKDGGPTSITVAPGGPTTSYATNFTLGAGDEYCGGTATATPSPNDANTFKVSNDGAPGGCVASCTPTTSTSTTSSSSTTSTTLPFVPGFFGLPGPIFPGWLQAAGYLDTSGGADEIPTSWCPGCTASYTKLKLVCGPNFGTYRYIDVNKNVFALGLASNPETGLITGSNFALSLNQIWANGGNPSAGTSWWVTGDGCNESNPSLTVNNACTWEAGNCFGQGLSGDRYLWVYVQ